MATTNIGKAAEAASAEYLKNEGFKIIELNWKTPRCEIDIVASKQGVIYFIEVKYRSSQLHGGGIDYITPSKINKMEFAARVWCQFNNWNGDWRLAAISVGSDGRNYLVDPLIEVE